MNKKLLLIAGAIIIGLLIFFSIFIRIKNNTYQKKIDKYEKELVGLQQQVKISEGLYSTVVDKYLVSEKALLDTIKERDKNLSKQIRKNRETILSYENYIITLKGQTDTLYLHDTILGQKSFTLLYPKPPEKPFITYCGLVDSLTVKGTWEFGSLPITGSIVEQKDGTWKQYISGPPWIELSGLQVKVLPKLDAPKARSFYFPIGAGYQTYFDGKKSIYLMGGIQYKRWQVLVHSSMYEAGIGGCYSF